MATAKGLTCTQAQAHNHKPGISIQPGFLLYIELIFVRFFAGIAGYVKKDGRKDYYRKQKDV